MNVTFDTANNKDISELIRLRIEYIRDDYGLDGEVLSVFTEKEYRGQGISTHLMNDVVNYAKENKLCYIDLKATDDGYSLYKNIGFEERNQKYKDMRLKLYLRE